jgi:glycerol-3-phosphate O-acyltransferase
MHATTTTPPQTGERGSLDTSPVVVLADARTEVERDLLSRWAAQEHPGAPVLAMRRRDLAAQLREAPGDPSVVPVRVTWLPREVDGERRTRVSDLLVLTNPRRPWPPMQSRIATREPDRVRVTVGEPARVSELDRRFREETGTVGADAFTAYVARQATLACERAERALIGDRYKVPRLVAEQITASAHFRLQVTELAERLDRPFDVVLAQATSCLRELAAVQSPLAIDFFRLLLGPLHRNAWTVEVDHEGLECLRDLNRRYALAFLPSHRSYSDPLLLSDVLDKHEFPQNHVLGGDNMAFWPLGPLGRRAGVVFIRRSFGDDPVYKLAVRSYFGYLVDKRFNVEWYMEGGRTRTGKLRPPRYGLLRYLVEALQQGHAEDVMLVPVSIVYDHLPEAREMTAELGGARKRGEGLTWLARYVRSQSHNVGTAQVNFGETFSLREALRDAGEGSAQLEKVAFRVCDGINRATPVTVPSLLTFALLGARDRALTLEQVSRVTEPLLDHVAHRGVRGNVGSLRHPAGLRHALDTLVRAGVATVFEGGIEPVWQIAPGNHHVAAFFRNGALHHLLNRALVELALLRLASEEVQGDAVDIVSEETLRLRDLLKFEFFFAEKPQFREQIEAELELTDVAWREHVYSRADAASLLASQRTLVAHRALRAFFDAHLVVARRLAVRNPREAIDRDAFLRECLGVGRQMLLQGQLYAADSVSQELFAGSMRLADNRDVVDPGRDEVAAARAAFLEEIEDVLARLVRIGELDAALLEEVLIGPA